MSQYPLRGYYQCCNACGQEFNNAPGARAYLHHLSESTYYGIRMSPEATWALGAMAREFLGSTMLYANWRNDYYPGWKPVGPDILPAAYGWLTFSTQGRE